MSIVTKESELTDVGVCQQQIDELVILHSAICGALVSTIDGFEVAASIPDSVSAAKVSAMTSSLLALSGAISNESGAGECRDITIDSSAGRILLMDIPHADRQLLLTVLCDTQATLGQALWAARRCRDEIGVRLTPR